MCVLVKDQDINCGDVATVRLTLSSVLFPWLPGSLKAFINYTVIWVKPLLVSTWLIYSFNWLPLAPCWHLTTHTCTNECKHSATSHREVTVNLVRENLGCLLFFWRSRVAFESAQRLTHLVWSNISCHGVCAVVDVCIGMPPTFLLVFHDILETMRSWFYSTKTHQQLFFPLNLKFGFWLSLYIFNVDFLLFFQIKFNFFVSEAPLATKRRISNITIFKPLTF